MSQSERKRTIILVSASVVLAAIIVIATLIGWRAFFESAENKIEHDFSHASAEAIDQLDRKFRSLEEDIKAFQAFFASSEEVSAEEWATYQERTDFIAGTPGVKGVFLVVPGNGSEDLSVLFGSGEGFKADWIKPASIPPGEEIFVLEVPRLPAPDEFLIMAPANDERGGSVGYIAVVVSYNDFFGDITEKDFLNNVNVRLSDASDPSSEILFLKDDPLTASKHPGNYAPPAEYELKLGEMVWTIRFSEGPGFRDEYNLSMMVPWLTVGIGSIIFLYSLALIIALLLLRRRAIRLVAAAREKLKESLGLYKNIFENSHDGIIILGSADGKKFVFRDINPSAAEMGRMDKNVAIGKEFSEMVPGLGNKKIIFSLRRAWKNGITDNQTIFYEDEFRRGWYEYHIFKISKDEVAMMYRDITARFEYEEELRKFQLAVENASDHIIITDRDGKVLFANKAASKITGYEIDEMMGNTPRLWGGLMSKEYYGAMWKTIKEDKKPFIGDITNKRKNGEEYIATVSISPVLNKKEEVLFFVGIEKDVTREKEIDKAKTEFVSLASHQLRTPLSIISWYTEMLLDGEKGKLNADQERYLLEVSKGNRRMIELVNALLNVSRIDMGTFMVEPKEEDIREVADVVYRDFELLASQKGVSLKKEYSGKLPKMNLDNNLTRIIFTNLLSNAVKYTPKGGEVSLKITANGKEKSVLIEVSDTGYGIPESQQGKIFTKLFRADNAQEIDPDGTGLGLYIARAIVKMANGEIWFTSKEGSGTTFYVTLPFAGMSRQEGNKGLIKPE